jgi:hypothetical protein
MLHLRSKPAPDVGPAASRASFKRHASTPVLISEQEVVFNTAAAGLVPAATTRRGWRATALIAALGRVHIGLPEPRPHNPRRDAHYFEGARMSRLMDHP